MVTWHPKGLRTTMTVSPTPTTIIHTIHPKTQILGDPLSVVRTRSKVHKNYEAHALSAFLYGTIDEEVYVTQPPSFVDPKFLNKVYKVMKALYGLHQAFRAWYATLSTFLEKSRYRRGAIDKTLFIKKDKKDIMLVQVYMSSMGELTFFLGLQIKQKEDGIFISQDKKSTTGGCQFLGMRLISQQCKKQTIMATSTTEAEYVTAAHCSTLVKGRLLEVTTAKHSKELSSPKQTTL
nr:copia protein [Tanacetum cinerariifolium]